MQCSVWFSPNTRRRFVYLKTQSKIPVTQLPLVSLTNAFINLKFPSRQNTLFNIRICCSTHAWIQSSNHGIGAVCRDNSIQIRHGFFLNRKEVIFGLASLFQRCSLPLLFFLPLTGKSPFKTPGFLDFGGTLGLVAQP